MLRKSSFVLLGLSVAFVVSTMLSITAEAGTVLSKGTVTYRRVPSASTLPSSIQSPTRQLKFRAPFISSRRPQTHPPQIL